jgi:heme-degrading monooxygenase HmoA
MILRTWRGTTSLEDADRYFDYLQATGVEKCRATLGNRGVWVTRRTVESGAEFLFLSLWDSMEAVRAFAGDEPEKGVFFPEDDRFLIEFDRHVKHFEVLLGPESGAVDRHDGQQ